MLLYAGMVAFEDTSAVHLNTVQLVFFKKDSVPSKINPLDGARLWVFATRQLARPRQVITPEVSRSL